MDRLELLQLPRRAVEGGSAVKFEAPFSCTTFSQNSKAAAVSRGRASKLRRQGVRARLHASSLSLALLVLSGLSQRLLAPRLALQELREQLFRVAPVVAACLGPLARGLRIAGASANDAWTAARAGGGSPRLSPSLPFFVAIDGCTQVPGDVRHNHAAGHHSLPCGRVWANSPMLLLKLAAIKCYLTADFIEPTCAAHWFYEHYQTAFAPPRHQCDACDAIVLITVHVALSPRRHAVEHRALEPAAPTHRHNAAVLRRAVHESERPRAAPANRGKRAVSHHNRKAKRPRKGTPTLNKRGR